MKPATTRGLLLTAAMLTALAVAASPAHARITPVNTALRGTSTNTRLTIDSSGFSWKCAFATMDITTSADGTSASGSMFFGSRAGSTTCLDDTIFSTSVDWRCRGTLTIRSTSSVAGSSASGDLRLDTGFECRISGISGTRTIAGPQTARGCLTLRQGPPSVMDVRNCSLVITGGQAMTYNGLYAFNRNITIS